MTDKLYLITEAQRDIVNAAISMGVQVIENGTDAEHDAFNTGFKVLQSLPMVSAEPVAHMYPWDLERFATNETTGHAYSVAVGCPNGKSVPLYTSPQAPVLVDSKPVARILHSKSPSTCDTVAKTFTEVPKDKWSNHWTEGENLYTSPQALTQISADDVTSEMAVEFANTATPHTTYAKTIAAAYNAVIKNRSEA